MLRYNPDASTAEFIDAFGILAEQHQKDGTTAAFQDCVAYYARYDFPKWFL